MSGDVMNRTEAPFGSKVWEKIDNIVVSAASSQLAGRRILEIEGPYGLGMKSVPGNDKPVDERTEVANITAELVSSPAIPLAAIQSRFSIPIRDIAAYEELGIEFAATELAYAAIAAARQEDSIIFNGSKALGIEGLTNLKAAESYKLSSWDEVGKSVDDIIAAVGVLDKAGFPGPYIMALAPSRYNLLFRRFMQGNLSEFMLLQDLITGGIVKALTLKEGGVLLARGKQFASIALGHDLMTIFEGPSGAYYNFSLLESVTIRVKYPGAICILKV